jgi:hypothetical protein
MKVLADSAKSSNDVSSKAAPSRALTTPTLTETFGGDQGA